MTRAKLAQKDIFFFLRLHSSTIIFAPVEMGWEKADIIMKDINSWI